MAYIKRDISHHLEKCFDNFPVVVVSGARQVGKSTLLKQVFKERAGYVELDPVVDIQGARSDPDLFLDNHKPPLIIDEIQYAPELSSAIKRRVDNDNTPGQYLLSGSQQWSMIRSLSESLAGRAVFVDLMSLSLGEMADMGPSRFWIHSWLNNLDKNNILFKPAKTDLTLYEHLWRGFLPKTFFLEESLITTYFESYERTYIERDIRTMAEPEDLFAFSRFFRLICALTAQEINMRHLGRELGIHPQTAKKWFTLLKSTYQWFELPAFHGNTIKRISSRSKGHINDTGMACFAQSITSPEAIGTHPLSGRLFESMVIGEIKKQLNNLNIKTGMYHWRTHSGAEVDCLIDYNGILFPIEVKLSSHPVKNDARGIKSFRKTFPHLKIGHGAVVAPCDSTYQITESDWVIPWNGKIT